MPEKFFKMSYAEIFTHHAKHKLIQQTIYLYLSQKTGFDISYKFSFGDNLHEMPKTCFLWKTREVFHVYGFFSQRHRFYQILPVYILNLGTNLLTTCRCVNELLDESQTDQILIRCWILWFQIWHNTVCWGL